MGNNKKNNKDRELFDILRATGLRKKVARTVSVSTAQAKDGQATNTPSELAHRTVRSLRIAAASIENRVSDDSTAHAKKAASSGRTKKRSAGRNRGTSGRGTTKKVSAPTRAARKTARPTATAGRRQTATRAKRTRARTSR